VLLAASETRDFFTMRDSVSQSVTYVTVSVNIVATMLAGDTLRPE